MPSENLTIVKRWLRRALPWAIVALLGWLVVSNLDRHTLLRSGSQAPELATALSGDSHFTLSEHRGQVVVVNFWATWCPPCRKEAPVLSSAHERLQKRDRGMVVGISADAQPLDEVTRAARKLGMDYPIGSAPDKALERFHVRNLPTTYVIAPDGTIVRSIVGAASDAELGEAIEEAWD